MASEIQGLVEKIQNGRVISESYAHGDALKTLRKLKDSMAAVEAAVKKRDYPTAYGKMLDLYSAYSLLDKQVQVLKRSPQ